MLATSVEFLAGLELPPNGGTEATGPQTHGDSLPSVPQQKETTETTSAGLLTGEQPVASGAEEVRRARL